MKEEKAVVYVVDDDPSVRRALERLLRSAGYNILTFTGASEFLDFNCPDTPGCLILDIKMPKLSGLELQDRLSEKGVFFPIIFMTAFDKPQWQERAKKMGAVAYLRKPFKGQALLDAIDQSVANTATTSPKI